MPLYFMHRDITTIPADAIVNAANPTLLGGGGVDGAIHRAAGPSLLAECRPLSPCPTGEARITGAGNLPCRYVIHTVGPIWTGGKNGEALLLRRAYESSLTLAHKHGCRTVAFPLLSSGAYGYPKAEALAIAVAAIRNFLLASHDDLTVYLVLFDQDSLQASHENLSELAVYLRTADALSADQEGNESGKNLPPLPANQKYRHGDSCTPKDSAAAFSFSQRTTERAENSLPEQTVPDKDDFDFYDEEADADTDYDEAEYYDKDEGYCEEYCASPTCTEETLRAVLANREETFSEMLLRKIDESGMTDTECYKRANIDRKLFSKIRSRTDYTPSKPTILAFAIALCLPLEETQRLLRTAGFTLSGSNKADLIITYFLSQGIYDIFTINEALFAFGQPQLGA